MQYTWQCTKRNKIPRWELKNVPVGKWANHYFANIIFHEVLCLICMHPLLLRCSMPLSCLSRKQRPSRLTWGVTLNHWMVVHLESGIATAAREAYYVVLAIVYSDGGLINGNVIRPHVEDDPYLSLILWADHNNVKRRFETTAVAIFHASLDNKWTSVITGLWALIRKQSIALHKHTYFHEEMVLKKSVICLLFKCTELHLSTLIWVLKHMAPSSCSNTILPQWTALVSWYGSLLTGLCYFSSWFTNFPLFKPLCWRLPTLCKDQTCLSTRSWLARLKIKLCAGFVKKCWVKCTNAKKICHVQGGNTPTLVCEVRHDPSTIRVGRLPVYDVKPCSTNSDLMQQREISCGTFVWFKWRSAGVYRSDSGQMIHYCLILLYYCGVNIWIKKYFRSCLDGDRCCVRWSCFHRFALFYHFWIWNNYAELKFMLLTI